jgi:hypothetical protein
LSLPDVRDVVIILWGTISILLLVALIVSIWILTSSVRRLLRDVSNLIDANVKPVIASAQESVDNVAGTTRFIGDRAVAPIIRVAGLLAAIRRGIEVFTGIARRRRRAGDEA